MDAPKPVLARIAGHCLGGGVGLAAACDLSIAAETARFGFTEVRLGVAPAVISVVCLPKLRRADALELFLSGERISAGRAVAAGQLDAEVAAMTGRLVLGGPAAVAAAKRLVYEVPGLERGDAFTRTSRRAVGVAVRVGRGGRGDSCLPGQAAAVLGTAPAALIAWLTRSDDRGNSGGRARPAELLQCPAPAGRVELTGHAGENLGRPPVRHPRPAGHRADVRGPSTGRRPPVGQEHRPETTPGQQPADQLASVGVPADPAARRPRPVITGVQLPGVKAENFVGVPAAVMQDPPECLLAQAGGRLARSSAT